jgi:DEAD/DEAH box helicase domain-containing protein
VIPLLEAGLGAIVFARSRQGVEILTRRLRESLTERRQRTLASRVDGYRGGYLPNDRRRIEKGLRAGTISAVVTTNALELGIDIGALDVAVLAGYPGSIASTWQQAGRAGRRQATALVVLVAGSDPVDQYIVTHPEYFFGAPAEHGRIDPDNLRIVAEHLRCAIYELPMPVTEGYGGFDAGQTQEVLGWLAEGDGPVQLTGTSWRWNGVGYPAQGVNLRDIHDENFVIVNITQPKKPDILGEIDFEAAHTTVYEKAIYQHAAVLYEVDRLDYRERKAWVREVKTDYYTQAIDQTRVFVLDVMDESEVAAPYGGWGEIRLSKRFVGYKKIRFKTFENIGYGEIALPDLEKHTTSYWCVFPSAWLAGQGIKAEVLAGALLGISQVMHTLALVHVMCAADDLLVTVSGRQGEAWESSPPVVDQVDTRRGTPLAPPMLSEDPAVFLYDRYPGGVGFSEKLHDLHDELLRRALELVESCPCGTGCPSCVGSPESIGEGGRAAALRILTSATRGPGG